MKAPQKRSKKPTAREIAASKKFVRENYSLILLHALTQIFPFPKPVKK